VDQVIIVIYGTTGELIKLGPVLALLEDRGTPALTLTTGQQVEQIPAMLDAFGLRPPSAWLGRGHGGRDLRELNDLPGWGANVVRRFMRMRPRLRDLDPRLVLVHGDTMTTVLGAAMGRSLGVPVAHIEAGLRSGDWRNPFPEEINRHLTSRIATLHFAPNQWAAENLVRAGVGGDVVVTNGNTMIDALRRFGDRPFAVDVPSGPFGLASLHRQELLGQRARLSEIVHLLREAAESQPVLFIDHPITAAALTASGLDGMFVGTQLRRVPRLPYGAFIALLRRAAWLVTDSGGSQEECSQLGIPCLVHRRATERQEGLGENVVLSHMDPAAVRAFLAAPQVLRRDEHAVDHSPSQVIVDELVARGLLD
jgi:UDP-N-acetylglucosamine 2-epimerase (non-hydrolysing)